MLLKLLFWGWGTQQVRPRDTVAVENSDRFAKLLLEHYMIALVPGRGFGAPKYIRLSYAASMNAIQTGLGRLEAFLKELK